jgi:hypothetical protein
MPLQDVRGPGILWPTPPWEENLTPAFTTHTLSGAGHKVGFVFEGSLRGQLEVDSVEFLTGTVTTGGNLDVRIESVDLATGFPSGTLLQANTNGTAVIADSDDDKIIQTFLTADADVGSNKFACVIAWSSGNMQIKCGWNLFKRKLPYVCTHNGTSWSDSTAAPVIGFRRPGTSAHMPQPGALLLAAINAVAVNTGTTPDEIGIKFQVPFRSRFAGFWWYGSASGDYQMKLYDANESDLETHSCDKDLVQGSGNGLHIIPVSNEQELSTNAWHYLTLLPTSGSNVTVYEVGVTLPERFDLWDGGQYVHRAERTDAGGFAVVLSQRPLMGIILDRLESDTTGFSAGRILWGM